MAGGSCSCLGQHIVAAKCRTVCKGERIGIALHLGGSVPLGLYLRVHGMGAHLGLLLGFLCCNALLFLQLRHSFIMQFRFTFSPLCLLLLTHGTFALVHECIDARPSVQRLLGLCHLSVILLHGGIVCGISLLLCLDHGHRRAFECSCFLGRLFLLQRINRFLCLLHLSIDNGCGVSFIATCHLVQCVKRGLLVGFLEHRFLRLLIDGNTREGCRMQLFRLFPLHALRLKLVLSKLIAPTRHPHKVFRCRSARSNNIIVLRCGIVRSILGFIRIFGILPCPYLIAVSVIDALDHPFKLLRRDYLHALAVQRLVRAYLHTVIADALHLAMDGRAGAVKKSECVVHAILHTLGRFR